METRSIADLVNQVEATSHALFDKQTQFLADIIAIRSYTGQETPAVQRTIKELKAIGCEETWIDTAGNALGKIGHGSKLILYDAHLDTNEVADENEWPHPPLQPTIENGAMWGLGASDCKGGVAAIVYGAAILKALHLEGDFTLVVMGATLEEDAEGFALRSLIERDGVHPDVVLLAEATDLSLRRGQRGRCEIRVQTKGKAAHASQPHLGESALLKMLPVMQALESMNPNLPENPIFGKGNQVISLIQGPHTPNSVPSWCEVTIDRRMVPGETMDSILNGIRAVVEPLGATALIPDQIVKTHTGQRLDGPSFYPGWLLEENHPLISTGFETCQALWGKAPKLDVWQFSTDGTYSAGVAGIPTLGFGPEEEKYVHAANDQVNLEKLRKAAEFYALFPVIFDRS